MTVRVNSLRSKRCFDFVSVPACCLESAFLPQRPPDVAWLNVACFGPYANGQSYTKPVAVAACPQFLSHCSQIDFLLQSNFPELKFELSNLQPNCGFSIPTPSVLISN